jgi:hypothetical protein
MLHSTLTYKTKGPISDFAPLLETLQLVVVNASLSCRLCKPNPQLAVVEDGVVRSHEDVTKYPASVSSTGFRYLLSSENKCVIYSRSAENARFYQSGPTGGGMSNAVNPLMH